MEIEAPVLSQSQMKKAVKKKVIKKSIRNVLTRPSTLTWPEITTNECENILNELRKCLQWQPKKKAQWSIIKDIPKNKRRETRSRINGNVLKSELIKYIIFGLNAITKGLEKHTISAVLVTSNSDPQQMIRHLRYSCNNSKIPLLIVPGFCEALKEIVGFSSLALAFKTIPVNCPLYNIYNYIKTLSCQFTISNEENIVVNTSKNSSNRTTKEKTEIDIDSIYLLRKTNGKVFDPSKSEIESNSFKHNLNLDFIEINDSTSENDDLNDNLINTMKGYTAPVFYKKSVPFLEQLWHMNVDEDMPKIKIPKEDNEDNVLKPLQDIISKGYKLYNKNNKRNKNKTYKSVKVKRLQPNPKRKYMKK